MKKLISMVIGIGLLIPISTYSQEFPKTGTRGAQFLKIGVGSRLVGMGEAGVALTGNGAAAIFWNPADLTTIEDQSVLLSHAEWLADISYEAGAYARTLEGIGTVGISFAFLTTGDMEETTVDQQEGTGRTFSFTDLAVGLSFARNLTDKFALGGNVKYVREALADFSGSADDVVAKAWGVDVGFFYYTGFRSLKMGMVIRNFGPELDPPGEYQDYDNGSPLTDLSEYRPYHMPMTFRFGLAMDIYESENQLLTAAVDAIHPNDNIEEVNLGAEYWLADRIAIRAGYQGRHDAAGLNTGAGFKFPFGAATLSVDYAFTDYGILDWTHRVSMGIDF